MNRYYMIAISFLLIQLPIHPSSDHDQLFFYKEKCEYLEKERDHLRESNGKLLFVLSKEKEKSIVDKAVPYAALAACFCVPCFLILSIICHLTGHKHHPQAEK